ncbi:DUF6249 domain-containing protein [Candidatus Omnitrophota bacterium]
MTAVFNVLIIFGSIAAIVIFIVVAKYKVRMEMIKKGPVSFTGTPSKTGSASLLIGLFSVAIGLAFFIMSFVHFFEEDIFTFGMFWILGGAAFLIYWKVTAGDREQSCAWYEQLLSMKKENQHIEA